MNDLNYLAIVVAAVAAMVLSTIYYIGFTAQLARLNPVYADQSARPPAGKLLVELVRNVVLATVIAWLVRELEIAGTGAALCLGVALWVGFPVVLWTGAVMWERVSAKLAAIHMGDWILKLLLITVIVTVWD